MIRARTTKFTMSHHHNFKQPKFILSAIVVVATFLLASTSLSPQPTLLMVDAGDSDTLLSSLNKLKITPDIIDGGYVNLIKVHLHGKQIQPGSPIKARDFKDIEISKTEWAISNNDAQHTLILLDLDRRIKANSTTVSMYNQFTAVNIPGHDIVRGQAIVSMEPPTVPCTPNSKHRILMLVFHQSQTIDLSDIINIAASPGQSSKRENFNLNTFIQRHRLNLVAANVFEAKGEQNGVCSGSSTSLNSFQSLSSIVIAMVIVGTTLSLKQRQITIGN